MNREQVLELCRDFLNFSFGFNSMKIRYSQPFVDRIWFDHEGYRINLHRIYSNVSAQSLWHPHGWEGMFIPIKNSIQVDLGTRDSILTSMVLSPPSWYDMRNPLAWHRVCPLSEDALTIMVSGPKFKKAELFPKPGDEQEALSSEEEDILLGDFHKALFEEDFNGEDFLS